MECRDNNPNELIMDITYCVSLNVYTVENNYVTDPSSISYLLSIRSINELKRSVVTHPSVLRGKSSDLHSVSI